jgi:hypothetical protein
MLIRCGVISPRNEETSHTLKSHVQAALSGPPALIGRDCQRAYAGDFGFLC